MKTLKDCDLQGLNLKDHCLIRCTLTQCFMEDCDLQNCRMFHCVYRNCFFKNCYTKDSYPEESSLSSDEYALVTDQEENSNCTLADYYNGQKPYCAQTGYIIIESDSDEVNLNESRENKSR